MKNKLALATLFVLCFILNITAQDSFDTNINVVPPSPNVLDINKGVELPVSYYTGSVNIEIPVHTLSLPQIDLPISLSYRASGLKVEDHASWIGAGWTLQAGGNISRTVKGLPDDLVETHRSGWFSSRAKTLFSGGSINMDTVLSCYSTETPFPITTPADPLTRVDSIAYGWIDTEPDLFYFSTPSGGGKFVFDHDYNLKMLQEDDFTITKPINLSGSYSWQISGPDGSIYVYEDSESTTSTSGCGRDISAYNDPMTHISAWQLNKIINSGDTIYFHYESEALVYSRKVTTSAKFSTSAGQNLPLSSCSNNLTVGSQRLSAITTSYGDSVSFVESSSQRADLTGSYWLDKIEVWKNGNMVKELDLDHDYFGSNDKLRLLEVEKKTTKSDGEIYPPYVFDYYSYGVFPSMTSTSIDYWGYYNGSTGGLFPPYKDNFNHVNRTSTADRNPSLNYARTGTLKSIQYPTGGKATFDYELHDYYDSAHEKTYFYEAEADGVIGESTPTSQLTEFTVGANCSATITKNVTLNAVDNYVEIQEKINGVYSAITLSASGNRLSLPAGEYAIYAYNSDPAKNAYISIEYEQNVAKDVYAGGLRIKSITEEDIDTQSGTLREFEYENASSQSSGILFSPIKMGGKTSVYVPGHVFGTICTDEPSIEYIEMNAYSSVPMDTYSGSHIGYSMVTEKISAYSGSGLPGGMGGGKTVYEYFNEAATISANFPFVQLVDLTHKNGKLLNKTSYRQTSLASFEEVKKDQYSYTEHELNSDVTRGFVLSRYRSKFCFSCEESSLSTNYNSVQYDFRRKWFRLDGLIRTVYHATDSLVSSTTYTYDHTNENHLFPVEEQTLRSSGDTLITAYTRGTHPALLIGIDRFEGATRVSGMRRTLKGRLPLTTSHWNNDLPAGPGQFENVLTVTYEGNRPISQVARDGTEVVYIWGYNNEYPVAKIVNATTSQVQALITSTYQGYLDDGSPNAADMKSLFQHLRSNLSNSLVTGYIYEPGSGILEVIDSNGIKQSYTYDGFRRLKDIKDNDGNFISAFQYLFQTQN